MNKFLLALTILLSTLAHAGDDFSLTILTPSAIKNTIGEFPKAGSIGETLDFDTLLFWQNTRTPEQCEYAQTQADTSIHAIFVPNNGPLSSEEAKKMEKKLFKKYAEAGLNIYIAKKLYDRPRPYDSNPEIKPCIDLESSSAYPSGHATIAQFLALELSQFFPERRIQFLKRASEASMNRVIGGVHHPSDVVAGQKLGTELFKVLNNKK